MSEATRDDILGALARAKQLLQRNRDWDLHKALAEATTSVVCGKPSYLIYAGVKNAILPPAELNEMAETQPRTVWLAAIDNTIKTLRESK
jgi:hypothetical protein